MSFNLDPSSVRIGGMIYSAFAIDNQSVILCVCVRGAAESWRLRGVRVRRNGGTEEPGESSAEQEPRAGATEQRAQQRPRPADTPGSTNTHTQAHRVKIRKCSVDKSASAA